MLLTCFPHFQSGPRITLVPTPSNIKRLALLDVTEAISMARTVKVVSLKLFLWQFNQNERLNQLLAGV